MIALAAACANVELPPGSAPDAAPPAVLERYPAPGAVVPDLDGDAWLRFDEPLQSPQSIERGLDLSPAWEWRFRPRRSGFAVRPREGWRPGVVYHIRVRAGVADLLRNTTRSPIVWSFSTGPELSETRIDGKIYTRVDGTGTRDARILFLPPDSTPYSVVSDTGGVYGIRSLPPGEYAVFGFLDENRNQRLDRDREAYDSATVSLPSPDSRFALDLWMTPPDSTPPVLVQATVFDTTTLVLEFDEPLEPEAPVDSILVHLRSLSAGDSIPVAEVRVGPPAPLAPVGEDADSREVQDETGDAAPGDSLQVPDAGPDDSLAAPGDSAAVEDPGEPEIDEPEPAVEQNLEEGERVPLQSAEARALPYPTLVVTLERPLRPDSFHVTVQGVRNLRGFVGAGDTTFVFEPPPVPEAPVVDLGDDSAAGTPAEDEVPAAVPPEDQIPEAVPAEDEP